ncbi:hypothetical protein [Mycobacteroides abscessus]|uniref:hypothetical protein n=1 Tax=Mycobacteroides abscessus TaxID=36809 RepID=UPI00078D3634|nr:hypothetical protein [Mycobacteroides abscessus]AMU58941.1 hypothetical protein A3O03_01260 [Mycobacteroides abscessus]
MKIIDTQREWIAVCIDCPSPPGEDEATWAFPGTDEGQKHADAFAKRHNSLQGHRTHVNEQFVVTASKYEGPHLLYVDPLRVGDAGDTAASIGERVTHTTVFTGRPAVYYLATCQECVDMKLPFDTENDRDLWADTHHAGTGHDVAPSVEIGPEED